MYVVFIIFFCLTIGVVACLIPGTLAGISITVKLSAVHRLVLNSGRPIIVWVISLALKWQDFNSLQLVGFIIMTVGVIIFNDILSIGNKKSYSEIHKHKIILGKPMRTLELVQPFFTSFEF